MYHFSLDPTGFLLRQAVSTVMQAQKGARYCDLCVSPNGVTFGISVIDPSTGIPNIYFTLPMEPLNFYTIRCRGILYLKVDIRNMHDQLLEATAYDFLSLSGHVTLGHIDFELVDARTKQIRATEISVISSKYGRIAIPRLFREYQVIVGIPAETFRIMIINLHHIGFQAYAEVRENVVFLGVGDQAVTLPKDERCIIEGDVGILLFSIENIKPLLSASILSKMVWLLGQSGGPYAALNFPFGKLGNMLFYFGPVF
ncbi:hypothetical protein PRUPE_2G163600 [Prunus persica]|uniref:Uncharacterized protein n=1 Tax=Prunus persica TaxID=3760 RepID=A0A251QGY3_PRUPE|nr:uncharacterized protein LOC109947630 [Prunus persica]ONI23003.1 hypothetical protein PRUPE_2G163600 [Prunus persica]